MSLKHSILTCNGFLEALKALKSHLCVCVISVLKCKKNIDVNGCINSQEISLKATQKKAI